VSTDVEHLAKRWREEHLSEGGEAAEIGFLAGYQSAKHQFADTSKVIPQWVSVKERLPDVKKSSCSIRRESACVLIVSYGNVYVAHLCEKWCDRMHFIFKACDCNCRGHDMECDEWTLEQVTHWQPLPEPPKEEK
jgi:hypothetical protein